MTVLALLVSFLGLVVLLLGIDVWRYKKLTDIQLSALWILRNDVADAAKRIEALEQVNRDQKGEL